MPVRPVVPALMASKVGHGRSPLFFSLTRISRFIRIERRNNMTTSEYTRRLGEFKPWCSERVSEPVVESVQSVAR